ncbi:urea active transport protein [Scheffersomyces xylosifermentans]|uniref:urea active transport protein n=1 Tax=Scheffersomyces xylosifermentans TaxID=1304137 RepID=UPI00315C9D84
MSEALLNVGYGYGFVLGLGAAFALVMSLITKVLSKYGGQVQNSERFSTASRNVNSGLIASSTVSAWTWPATLLAAGTWSYSHGIMGGFMYGVGGTIQITLFVFLAIQIKLRAPSAHTVSECFSIRYGRAGHCIYLCYCVATNILVSSLLLLGGSQAFSAATGMHTVAASFLLPLGVMVYTALGGLKATFISDWIHTVVIYVILLVSCYTIYCSSSLIGSPAKMYELLKEVQEIFPSETGSSYLSFRDKEMMLLTWTVMLGGLSSVFGDPGYSQRAIASDAKSVFYGYIMGAICWWIIPGSLGLSAGLACRALLTNPASVTYPRELSSSEVNSALPVIYGLAAIFGRSGATAGLVMVFMSVTSATSAELIAFSSVTTYDVYRTYINPSASGVQLVRVGHLAVIGFSLFMAVLSTIFNYIGVTSGWLLSFVGIVLSPEVSAVILTLFWNKITKTALIIGAPMGTLSGVVCWIGATYSFADGVVDKNTVMLSEATFVGNIVALVSTPIYICLISFIFPEEEFDLTSYNRIALGDDIDEEEKTALIVNEKEKRTLWIQSWWCLAINVFILIGCYIIIPCALYGSGHDLSKGSFTALIVVFLIWLLLAALYIILYPLWQGRHAIRSIIESMLGKNPIQRNIAQELEDKEFVEIVSVKYQSKK